MEGAETFDYHAWDSRKTRACVCDPTYTDIDCSKRMCGFGTDPLDTRDNLLLPLKYQTQKLVDRQYIKKLVLNALTSLSP